jgi:hypothetical protein
MIYACIKCQIPGSKVSLIIAIKATAKFIFIVAAILFYVLQTN